MKLKIKLYKSNIPPCIESPELLFSDDNSSTEAVLYYKFYTDYYFSYAKMCFCVFFPLPLNIHVDKLLKEGLK